MLLLLVLIVTTVGYKPLITGECAIFQVAAGRTNASIVSSHDMLSLAGICIPTALPLSP